jgi:hypothetical protein
MSKSIAVYVRVSSAGQDLATCQFIEKSENVLIYGPCGVGKIHVQVVVDVSGSLAFLHIASALIVMRRTVVNPLLQTSSPPLP